MENRMMNKNEVLQRIDAVCKNLDGGITVSDVRQPVRSFSQNRRIVKHNKTK